MKHFLLLASLLTGSMACLAQDPASDRPAQQSHPRSGLAPTGNLMRQTEATRPAATVRHPARISTYTWDVSAGQWGPGNISLYTYDSQGRAASIVSTDSLSQQPTSRTTYTYNSTTAPYYLSEVWQAGTWQNSYRYFATFDAQNRVTEYVNQQWINGAWENTNRNQIAYDARGNLTQSLYQRWTNNAWATTNGSKYDYTYDAANRVIEEAGFVWENFWKGSSRTFYTYAGSSLNYSSITHQLYNRQSAGWSNTLRYQNYTYTAQGKVNSYEFHTWDGTTWQLHSRTVYTYPISGPGYSYLSERVSGTSWENYKRYNSIYDARGTFLSSAEETWLNTTWVPVYAIANIVGYDASNDLARRLSKKFDFTNRVLVNSQKSFYTNYQTIVLGTKAKAAGPQVQLYPNPTAGTATLELAAVGEVHITVLNALGQTVQQLTALPQAGMLRQPLNTAPLPAGVYSVRVSTAAGTTMRQLVRQ